MSQPRDGHAKWFSQVVASARDSGALEAHRDSSTEFGYGGSLGYYDATETTGRRRPPQTRTMSEDWHADARRRRMLSATSRDLARNFAIARWAIGKHLDFVADFNFQAKTKDKGYNAYLEEWHARRSKRKAFDVAGRHNQRRAVRLAEACKTVDGDVGWVKLIEGDYRGTIQAIESDRIDSRQGVLPRGTNLDDWVNGVRVDPLTGRALEYAVCNRTQRSGLKLAKTVAADNMIMLAAYGFRYDMVRGVSPIASAINHLRDTQEGIDFAFAKLKVGQLFGLQIYHDSPKNVIPEPPRRGDEEGDDEDDVDSPAQPRVDFRRGGPFVMELDKDEKAEVLESRTPSSESVAFLKMVIHISLRALDIPFSFFDESFTNFYGSRGGLLQYLHSCNDKVLDLQEFMDDHTGWRAAVDVADGELELPSGKDLDWLRWEHVPGGVPWWDQANEVRGQSMAIASGFTSPQRVCRETGTNFEQNILETAEAMRFAKENGVDLVYADASAFAPNIVVGGNGNEN